MSQIRQALIFYIQANALETFNLSLIWDYVSGSEPDTWSQWNKATSARSIHTSV